LPLSKLFHSLSYFCRFDLQLENWGLDVAALKVNIKTRTFRAWIEEEWEEEAIRTNDPVAMAKLLQKYKNLRFFDDHDNMMVTVYDGNLEWRHKDRSKGIDKAGWYLITIGPDGGDEDGGCWEINQEVCEMIASQEQDDSIQVVRREK
jgi:hypothetical protein